MIKAYNTKAENIIIAQETLQICKDKKYTSPSGKKIDISKELDAAINGSIIYKDDLPDTDWKTFKPTIEVINETAMQAAVRLAGLGKQNIVALNFANACNPGGAFLVGARAQEEDLCRASGLYPCIRNKPMHYNSNILCDHDYYTDSVIYSPNVPFFRDDCNVFLENPFTLSIITAPAPNLNNIKNIDDKKLIDVLSSRINKILKVAATNEHKTIILGGWGCGAFGNDPNMVATIFKEGLMFTPAFEHVCFAVYDTREPPILYETFKNILSK